MGTKTFKSSTIIPERISTLFLQVVIVLIGIAAFIILIRFPLTEGRAENLDLFSIYSDPFILYGYATSIVFFVALYKIFRLLGYIGQNQVFSSSAIGALKSIKKCALLLSILIVGAGVYIGIFHNKDDDPVGFFVLCFVTTFASITVATAASVFERILQNGIDITLKN